MAAVMNLSHLRYFTTVAAEHSFTRAAERLHVVQSAVSAGIKTLEKELGAELFDRSAQRVRLTGAGEALLPRALETLAAAREARDAVLATHGRVDGTLHLGGMTIVGLVDVPGLLGAYHRRHPAVAVRLRMDPSGSAGHFRSLLAGELDAAFVSPSGPPPIGLKVRELASARLVLAVPAGHRLAGRDSFAIADLADESFVDSPVGYGNRDTVDRAFAEAGVQRRVALEVTDIGTSAAFVRYGLGVALMPEFVLAAEAAAGADAERGPDAERGADAGVGAGEGLRVLRPASCRDTLLWSFSLAVPARRPTAPVRALLALVEEDPDRFVLHPPTD